MFAFKPDYILARSETGATLTGADCNQLKSVLFQQMERRSLVFLLCSNSVGSLAGYVAFVETGAVPVMLDAAMDDQLLTGLVDTYQPRYFWVPDNLIAKVGRNVQKVLDFGGYVLLKNLEAQPVELHPDLALLLTTSGSTGSPKFVRLSYQNIEANARSISQYLELTPDERPITSLPMHYSYGLSVINSHLVSGATVLLTERSITQKEFWTFFDEYRATSFAGVPYTYQMLMQFRLLRREMPSLRTLTQAGGKLSGERVLEMAEWAQANGKRFVVMYGQTEATARMSYLPWPRALDKSASIGVAIPGGEFSIIDTDDRTIEEPNQAGELLYRGPNVSMGYAQQPDDLAAGDENQGLLRTGDVAQRDEEGLYYIVGRLKRFIKIFGNRVNLDQAEQLAKHLTPDVACTGVDDKLMIHVVDPAKADEVRQYLVEKTGLHPSAIEVKVVAEIPKNSSGKVQYGQL